MMQKSTNVDPAIDPWKLLLEKDMTIINFWFMSKPHTVSRINNSNLSEKSEQL